MFWTASKSCYCFYMINDGGQDYAQAAGQPSSKQSLQQPTGNTLQLPQTQGLTAADQRGVLGVRSTGQHNPAAITVSTSSLSQAQTLKISEDETVPLTKTSFSVDSWMIVVGGAILAVVVVSFLVTAFKDRHGSI